MKHAFLDKISFLNEGDKTTDNNSISQEKLKMTETERNGKKKVH